MKVELEKLGYQVSRPKAVCVMKALGLVARRTRKFKDTTDSSYNYPIYPNRLNQNFKVKQSGQVWVSDITYIETKDGWIYNS